MKPILKTTIACALVAVATYAATTIYQRSLVSNDVVPAMIRQVNEVETFNDIGRVEVFDTLESFLVQGCIKEAQEFVGVQQSLLLSDIARKMDQGESTRKMVLERNAEIADRADETAKVRNPPRVTPKCKR